jgi:dTDP-4-amino-4,6-dideoxygalactose transaminase
MEIVSYPDNFIDLLVAEWRELLKTGSVAEGKYYNDVPHEYVPGKMSIPVASGGAAIFSLLAYQKFVLEKTHVIVQSNTMRALYTVPKLLGLEVVVCESSIDDQLAMNAEKLKHILASGIPVDKAVVLYSVIGGYMAQTYYDIESICVAQNVPLIIDLAHGHYLDGIISRTYPHLAFSFYATKILPSGEGGLISLHDQNAYQWVRRFLIYDRFKNEFEVGLNLRANELTASFIHSLMNNQACREFFRDRRVSIGMEYLRICLANNIACLNPTKAADYNGYKFVVLEPWDSVIEKKTGLTRYKPSSPVFGTDVRGGATLIPHWCPPTYSSLYSEIIK